MRKITERVESIFTVAGLIALVLIVFGVTYVFVRRMLWLLGIPLMTVLAVLLGGAV